MKIFSLFLATTLAIPVLSPLLAQPAKAATSRSWVALKATTDQSRYTVGQPIAVRLTATNTHKSGAYLRFTSGQRFDFSVYRSRKSGAVYTWSASRMFLQSLGSLWLKPGQQQYFKANIGDEMGQLKPGKYYLKAHLTNSPRTIDAAPITFEVVDLGLSMTARTNKTSYKVGEPVKIDMTVSNRFAKENRVTFNSGMTFDAIITDESENQIWTYGANLRFIRVLGNVTWKKGETKKFSATWNGVALPGDTLMTKLKPGRYRVQGVLQSAPLLYAAPIFIDIS